MDRNYTVRNEHMCVIYLFRRYNLVKEQCGWNIGWNDEEEGKEDKLKLLL